MARTREIIRRITLLALILILIISSLTYAQDACTDIIVGKAASADGSVITSHTECCPDCRVFVVPAQTFKKGDKAPVYYRWCDAKRPLGDLGDILGYIPQVKKTFAYFHSGYSHMNEHQLAIGESTTFQKDELKVDRHTGKQIMTVDMATVFALQRCKTAREAIKLITSLMETYGFLPSAGPNSETLCIADPEEAWVLELFSVGFDWSPESGKLGVLWAAQRVPDDHVAVVPNWSIIREINLDNPDYFMASTNYQQVAIDYGWYDPDSGQPFIWREVYTPIPKEFAISRLWLFYTTYAPSLKEWPKRKLTTPFSSYNAFYQELEPLSLYPFSVKPEKKLSVQDVIAYQRSVFEGTIYDMTADVDWLIPDGKGGFKKSPLTNPFPRKDMRDLLDITWRRVVSMGGYGMIAQLRSWLPDPIGGVYWYYVDNQYVTTYVPIYAGTQEISPYFKTYDPDNFSEDSAKWVIDFVDNLLHMKWQEAVKELKAVRDPLEARFFADQPAVEEKALKLYKKDVKGAKDFLTDYTMGNMEEVMTMYKKLRHLLISKYTNNKEFF